MPLCFVRGCSNATYVSRLKEDVTFHNANTRKRSWLIALGKDPAYNIAYERVCSEYFAQTDFEVAGERKRLRTGTIPTLKLPQCFEVDHLEKSYLPADKSSKLKKLLKQLDSAERRAKLLSTEVKSIRQEILVLKNNLSGGLPKENSFIVHTKKTINLISSTSLSSSSDDNVDSPLDNPKRFKGTFQEDDGYVTVFTDGACENNGKSNAKAGIGVWFGDYHHLNVSKPVEGKATNNTAEIQACIESLKVLEKQGVNKVKIFTDSQFTINCITKWMNNWKRNNWKTAAGGDVKNKEDLKKLDDMIKQFLDVKWQHVAGHKGIKGNEAADKLAREGALRYKPN